MMGMARDLKSWYSRRHADADATKLTEVQQLSKRLLGTPAEQTCKTKGAETWGVLLFLNDLLREKLASLPPEAARFLEAGTCIARLMLIFDDSGVRLTATQIQTCWDLYTRFLSLTAHMPEMLFPKRHLFIHLIHQLHAKGNPRFYANWRDEGLNKLLRSACRALSQATFEPTLLLHMEKLLQQEDRGRRGVREGR